MRPAAKRAPKVSDEQAMAWARAYYKADDGNEWEKPPAWSSVVDLVDALAAEVEALRRAVRDPLGLGNAKILETLSEDDRYFGGSLPVASADVWFYALAFKWAGAGASPAKLRRLERARAIRSAYLAQELADRKTREVAEAEERHQRALPSLRRAAVWTRDLLALPEAAELVRRYRALEPADGGGVMFYMDHPESIPSVLDGIEAKEGDLSPKRAAKGGR